MRGIEYVTGNTAEIECKSFTGVMIVKTRLRAFSFSGTSKIKLFTTGGYCRGVGRERNVFARLIRNEVSKISA